MWWYLGGLALLAVILILIDCGAYRDVDYWDLHG